MKTYKFEIQNLIEVQVEGDNPDDARMRLLYDLGNYADLMIEDCYVSDGTEVK